MSLDSGALEEKQGAPAMEAETPVDIADTTCLEFVATDVSMTDEVANGSDFSLCFELRLFSKLPLCGHEKSLCVPSWSWKSFDT